MNADRQTVLNALRATKKYGQLPEETLGRAVDFAFERAVSTKRVVKLAKRKLHQAFGAYLPLALEHQAVSFLQNLPAVRDPAALRTQVLPLLSSHVSTRERVPLLEHLYDRLFAVTGSPRKVLDVACGLHPLEIPWMGLAQDVRYGGLDIDKRQVKLLNAFLKHLRIAGRIEWRDALADLPRSAVDVAFVLKSWPCLERQQPGAGTLLVNSLAATWVVVSFPSHSLSGAKRRMGANYARDMARLAELQRWELMELTFPQEVFFLIRKPPKAE